MEIETEYKILSRQAIMTNTKQAEFNRITVNFLGKEVFIETPRKYLNLIY